MSTGLFPHTHVKVDAHLHKIANVEDHPDGPRHTHRIYLGCGMTIDTDFGGQRHAAAAAEQRAVAVKAKAKRMGEVEYHEAIRAASVLDASALRHHADHADPAGRWSKSDKAIATCARCSAVEAGAPAHVIDHGHNAPSTVHADIPTGVRCPLCDSMVLKRHPSKGNDGYACAGQGHELEAAELFEHARNGLQTLMELTK